MRTRQAGLQARPRFSPARERRLLQAAVGLLALVPILAGTAGACLGLRLIEPHGAWNLAGDSHVRYLSGLILAIGVGFWSTVPRIELQGARFRLLTALVLVGGIARLGGLFLVGFPGFAMLGGLLMELAVAPALALWRERLERRFCGAGPAT